MVNLKQACGMIALLVLCSVGTQAAPANATDGDSGFTLSIIQSSQMHFDSLAIGVRDMGTGLYTDAKGEQHSGLHVDMSVAIAGKPKSLRKLDAVEGQSLTMDDYRIRIERIQPKDSKGSPGILTVRIWAPPSKAKH